MRGRSKAGSVKSRRKPVAAKRARGTERTRPRSSSASARDETLEQLAATSELLEAISHSTFDLQTVLASLVKSAGRLCQAENVQIFLYDGEFYRLAADNGFSAEYQRYAVAHPIRPGRDTLVGRTASGNEPVQIPDALADSEYAYGGQKLGGYRTLLGVPLLKDEKCIGVIALTRSKVHPFTDRQIALVTNFAAQAVIAIENARLLNELRESLEQQTATADVLRVISSSPGELEPVFQTMLENATRICDAKFGFLWLAERDGFRAVAFHNVPPALAASRRQDQIIHFGPETPLGRLTKTRQLVHVADIRSEPSYVEGFRPMRELADIGGARTLLMVPMLKESEVVGAFAIYRQEVRPFTAKHIALVQNFAAQAVIAIENARLLNELRQRTADLSESLEQQTATSDVLRVISGLQAELEPVFQAILENATRICAAKIGILFRFDDGAYTAFATLGVTAEYDEYLRRGPIRAGPGTGLGRVAASTQTVHIIDIQAEQTYADGDPLRVATAELGGARSLLNVPMLKDGELIGAIGIYRQEVRPFTDKQVELITNFAAQAVIAIENARLLNELRQRTEEVSKLNQQLERRVSDQVGEIERMGRLRRFLPPQVADLIVASGTEKQLESHRREITALFCDLRGFTGFSESSDPEDVMTLLADYHAAIGNILIKYSGTLERYAGDGVMVIFNDPVPVENPALQAVLMALDMRTAIGGLIEKWRDLGHDLGFGIGIAHGFATLGTIGFEGRRDYAAIGTVSNVASRLCDEAKPGQILISPRVRQAVEKAVTIESVGEFALKGIRRPMLAYNVLEVSPVKLN